MLLCTLTLFPGLGVSYNNFAYSAYATDIPYGGERESSQPIINDPNLKLELVSRGLKLPTQMAFIGPDDILVLEKEKGIVKRIVNGTILEEPLLDVNVATSYERGLIGIAIAENDNETRQRNSNIVYLYYTESEQDANDDCSSSTSCSDENEPLGNRLYRYELVDNKLVNPKLVLDLPASPGPAHNGGSILIGPDNNIYIPIGEVSYLDGQISNHDDGPPPDGRGGILRVTQQGEAVGTRVNDDENDENDENSDNDNSDENSIDGILGDEDPLNKYYAYGIRNSYGIDFDPVTGNLWDTENGPSYGDEINLVEPGFNSGWSRVQGIWEREGIYAGPIAPDEPDNLVDFDGKGKYSTPEFAWNQTVGVTSIKFLDSDKLGKEYENDLLVADINNGNIYHFELNAQRTELILMGALADKVADTDEEDKEILFASGFNGITDIEIGPDGSLYVLSFAGEIFRISSQG